MGVGAGVGGLCLWGVRWGDGIGKLSRGAQGGWGVRQTLLVCAELRCPTTYLSRGDPTSPRLQ